MQYKKINKIEVFNLKKRFQKLLCAAFMLTLLCVLLTVSASAEVVGGYCGGEGDGTNLSWSLDTETGAMTISGTGAMASFAETEPEWAAYAEAVSSITVESGVTSISEYSFAFFTNLTSVSIADSVSSIGELAFFGCSGITEISINAQTIGTGAFRNCSTLETVEFGPNVQTIGMGAFMGCTSLNNVVIPSNVTTIESSAFSDCSSLSSITFPETPIVLGDRMFWGCTSLEEFVAPDTTAIGAYFFYNCTSLRTITFSPSVVEFDPSAVEGCVALEEFILAEGNYNFEVYVGALYDPNAKVLIKYPQGSPSVNSYVVEGTDVKIVEAGAFANRTMMKYLVIASTVTEIRENAFAGCENLSVVYFLGDNEAWNNMTIGEGNEALLNATLYTADSPIITGYCGEGENFESVMWTLDTTTGAMTLSGEGRMGEFNFAYIEQLKSLAITDGVLSISEGAFSFCNYLESVSIADSVEELGTFAFYGCDALTSIHIPSAYVGAAAFRFCTYLETVTFGPNVQTLDNSVFADCVRLESIVIPSNITEIGPAAFAYCTSLKTVEFPETPIALGYRMFWGCTALEEFVAPNTEEIGEGFFLDCTSLKSITFSPSVVEFDPSAVEGCVALEEFIVAEGNESFEAYDGGLYDPHAGVLIRYPQGRTNAAVEIKSGTGIIEGGAFAGNTYIEEVTIPVSVTEIRDGAFMDCTAITDVYYGATSEEWSVVYAGADNFCLMEANIHFNDAYLALHGSFYAQNSIDDVMVVIGQDGWIVAFGEAWYVEDTPDGCLFYYEFSELAPGKYDIVFTKSGHLTFIIENYTVSEGDGRVDIDGLGLGLISLVPGDVNDDGYIDGGDIASFVFDMGKPAEEASTPFSDLNNDGYRDASDVTILAFNLFRSVPTIDLEANE